MRRNSVLLLLLVASMISILATAICKLSTEKDIQGVQCGAVQCSSSDLCCEKNLVGTAPNQCYDSARYDCLPDKYVADKNSLCPSGHYAGCNGVCFDILLYYCDASGKVKSIDNLIATSSSLSDPLIITTINVAQSDWTAGENPSFSGKTVADVVPLAGTKLDPPQERAIAEPRAIKEEMTNACTRCPRGNLCCSGTCYNPAVHQCLSGFLCPIGHYRCGNACYSQTRYSCFPGNLLCPINTLPCGIACYSATMYDCCNSILKPKGTCPETIPVSFNSISKWPNCINPIGNQGDCGSCWAFSAAQILGDRHCISKNLGSVLSLSPQFQVSCDRVNLGCSGGWLDKTWSFLATTGIPTSSCVPYSGKNGVCPNKCANNSPLAYYKSVNALRLRSTDLPAIQREILKYGPIQAGFTVYTDFFYYKSGVYSHKTGGVAGGHAVRVVGWGVESSTNKKYWIVANSWGTGWGINGYVWISRGNNECGIESNMWRALAA